MNLLTLPAVAPAWRVRHGLFQEVSHENDRQGGTARQEEASLRRLRYSRAGILQPDDVDGRSRFAWRYRRLSDEIAADLEGELGRPLSSIERMEIGNAVRLLLRSQTETDVDAAIRLCSESRRLLEGLKPKVSKNKPVGHHDPLAAHLRAKYGTTIAHNDDAEGDDAEDVAAVE